MRREPPLVIAAVAGFAVWPLAIVVHPLAGLLCVLALVALAVAVGVRGDVTLACGDPRSATSSSCTRRRVRSRRSAAASRRPGRCAPSPGAVRAR